MLRLIPTEHWDYGARDAIHGLRVALSFWRPDSSQQLLLPDAGPGLAIRSGRAALVLALKALALPPGSVIGVPLYCCPVVFKAIKVAGHRPCFIDVDPETYCLSAADLAAKNSKLDAVIAVHMFGNVCDMPTLRKSAPGKPFIEDCAQALGSRLYRKTAGSFSEIAIFSFRSGKYLSVGEGGAIYSNNARLKSELSTLTAALPGPRRTDEVAHVAATFLRSSLRRRPLWGLIGNGLWSAYSRNVSHTNQSPIVMGKIYQSDHDMAIRRLRFLQSCIEKQRSNADYYSRNLIVDSEVICSETPGAFFNRLQFPLLSPTSADCGRLTGHLLKNQISTARPYSDIAAIAAKDYGYSGDCPQAESIAGRVFVIPCNYALKTSDIERIVGCVNRAWAELGCQQGLSEASTVGTTSKAAAL